MARRSLNSLGWLNFFVADTLSGFGPFVSVYLVAEHWSQTDIGFALSVGTVSAMLCQIPAGALVDAVHSNRAATAGAMLAIMAAALGLAIWPQHWLVMGALVVQGAASCILTPAIAAITLSLSRQEKLGEQFGDNVRFRSVGAAAAAGLMGAVGSWISYRAVFFLAAAFAAATLAPLRGIRAADLAEGAARTDHPAAMPRERRRAHLMPKRHLWQDRRLLIFTACAVLFHLANAAVLQVASPQIASLGASKADLVLAASIVVSQAIAALLSPGLGRLAQARGRRLVLLIGFAALPVRCLLFATSTDGYLVIAYQMLDGLSASVFGVMVPLVLADITRRGGRFNLALGIVGFGIGIGATLSTALAGLVADHFGTQAAFLALAAAGAAATLLVLFAMPETRLRDPVRARAHQPA